MNDCRQCSKCRRLLALTAFYADCRAPDGRASQCKSCVRIRQAKYRDANIDAIRAYDRARKKRNNTAEELM